MTSVGSLSTPIRDTSQLQFFSNHLKLFTLKLHLAHGRTLVSLMDDVAPKDGGAAAEQKVNLPRGTGSDDQREESNVCSEQSK
jgi:hypothetical protein